MYNIPATHRVLPMLGDGSTPSTPMAGPPRAMRRRHHLAQQPWESMAVQSLANKLSSPPGQSSEDPVTALVLKSPQGTLLRAVGAKADHEVAGRILADIEQGGSSGSAPQHDSRTKSLAKVGGGLLSRQQVAFGAVYEHRDSCGKPRLVGSTNVLPERQFQIDWQEHSQVRSLASDSPGGGSGHLVWAGIGSGVVGEQEMGRVREAIVHARSERLQLQKLSSEKPYSRHF
mmetsp:Transcript_60371/g.135965  ORF Transcript_60371/g.135965 Transcript_60371/m.135965 type:complete len:230 (+) Transcript_60371:58-747(+)